MLRPILGAQFEFTLAAIAQNLRRLAKLAVRPPDTSAPPVRSVSLRQSRQASVPMRRRRYRAGANGERAKFLGNQPGLRRSIPPTSATTSAQLGRLAV